MSHGSGGSGMSGKGGSGDGRDDSTRFVKESTRGEGTVRPLFPVNGAGVRAPREAASVSDFSAKAEKSQLIDFSQIREKAMGEKRRQAERVFFQRVLGVYCVTGKSSLRGIELQDVSEEGLSFRVPFDTKNPWPRESGDLPLRMYFSEDTYLEIRISIENTRDLIEDGVRYVRYGCSVDRSLASYEAYRQFVGFLKLYSEQARRDEGGTSVYYL